MARKRPMTTEELFNRINITMDSGDKATDDLMKNMIEALNQYILALAEKQICLAFNSPRRKLPTFTRGQGKEWKRQG